MKKIFIGVIAIISLIMTIGCSSSTPTGGGGESLADGGKLSEHAGNNAPITEGNKGAVSTDMIAATQGIFDKVEVGGIARHYAQRNPGKDTTIVLDTTINGDKSGYAELKGTVKISTTLQGSFTFQLVYKIEYFDYSDDGIIYFGGAGNATMTMSGNALSGGMNMTGRMIGGYKFNGAYVGTCDYTMDVTAKESALGMEGVIKFKATLTSEGKTFTVDMEQKFPE